MNLRASNFSLPTMIAAASLSIASCSHEVETLKSVTAGQHRGMDVHHVNDSIDWDEPYIIHTVQYEGHDFKIVVSSPTNSPGSSDPPNIRIWSYGELELSRDEIDFALGIDTILGSSFNYNGSAWEGSIHFKYVCNSPNPIDYSESFYTYERGETIDLNRDWDQPRNLGILRLPNSSNAPMGVDTSRPDTMLYKYYSWENPSCGYGILHSTEGYFMIKLTRDSDIYLGWIKYGFNRNAWPRNKMLYIDSWAISTYPIDTQ